MIAVADIGCFVQGQNVNLKCCQQFESTHLIYIEPVECTFSHVTFFSCLSVLIVEHEVWQTLSHKELLHAVNLRKMKRKQSVQSDTTVSQTVRRLVAI